MSYPSANCYNNTAMDESQPAVKVTDLTFHYGQLSVLTKISFEVPRGSFWGFVGPNGAGKTTLLRILTGLLRPTCGRVEILGTDVVQHPLRVKQIIGVVSEEPVLYDYLTVREYLHFIGRIYGLNREMISQRLPLLLESLHLTEKTNALCQSLSHGMRKKVEFAAALIHDPQILFLDEPFYGIDPIDSLTMREILESFVARGRTVVLTSHVLEIVERLCDWIAVLDRGAIVGILENKPASRKETLEFYFHNLLTDRRRPLPPWWDS